jgi:hypothetical protein
MPVVAAWSAWMNPAVSVKKPNGCLCLQCGFASKCSQQATLPEPYRLTHTQEGHAAMGGWCIVVGRVTRLSLVPIRPADCPKTD